MQGICPPVHVSRRRGARSCVRGSARDCAGDAPLPQSTGEMAFRSLQLSRLPHTCLLVTAGDRHCCVKTRSPAEIMRHAARMASLRNAVCSPLVPSSRALSHYGAVRLGVPEVYSRNRATPPPAAARTATCSPLAHFAARWRTLSCGAEYSSPVRDG